MSDLTAAQVKETVDWLEHDSDHVKMREAAKSRHDLVNMLKVPEMPEHITRGVGVAEPSPILIWLRDNIAADLLPYPTDKTVTPFGTNTDMQEQADKIEKWLALFHIRVDEAKRITSDGRDHQMLSPYFAMILRCGAMDEDFPWSIEIPDPDTCYFAIERAPFRPPVFGRRFKQLVRDAEKAYSGKKNYKNGTWDNKAGLWQFMNGEWRMGSDHPVTGSPSNPAGSDRFVMKEFYELHEDEMVYIVGEGDEGKNPEILWQGKSWTGGPSVVIGTGTYSSVGPVSERLRPMFWPAMQAVNAINRIRALRASRSEANKPDMLVERTPEQAMAASATGNMPGLQAEDQVLNNGGPSLVYVNGKSTPWNMEPDPDLDKREQSWWTELNRYIDSISEVTEPEVIKDVGVNSYLTNLESRKRKRAPMLANLDWCWNEIFKMAIRSIGEYGKEFPLYATSDDIHVKLKKGQSETIGPKDVADFEKSFWLSTETRSTTEAEKRARIQDWVYNKQIGIATQIEGVDIAYQDRMRQVEQLFIDLGVSANQDWVKAQVVTQTQERIRLRGGVDIGGVGAPPVPQGPPPGPPASQSTGTPPMQPATVAGPAGGSGQAA